ncbi:hypothetical protein JR316_0007300 [Psilocybe cubensis]|uniref:Uncharacterized protein n=2 Tax=Psilocybe cubensis TaxID=181762 RepID=A0ACB8GY75_PSICU|nr:hypothetical protein JR316_0007300 [Psilocybe cubensis]KAH9480700.1 hypothetical protein JR316_0007300 [Psilocybe cubensis]
MSNAMQISDSLLCLKLRRSFAADLYARYYLYHGCFEGLLTTCARRLQAHLSWPNVSPSLGLTDGIISQRLKWKPYRAVSNSFLSEQRPTCVSQALSATENNPPNFSNAVQAIYHSHNNSILLRCHDARYIHLSVFYFGSR